MTSFCIAWFLYGYVMELALAKQLQLLSNWTEILMNIYFLAAFLVSIYAVANRNNSHVNNAGMS